MNHAKQRRAARNAARHTSAHVCTCRHCHCRRIALVRDSSGDPRRNATKPGDRVAVVTLKRGVMCKPCQAGNHAQSLQRRDSRRLMALRQRTGKDVAARAGARAQAGVRA